MLPYFVVERLCVRVVTLENLHRFCQYVVSLDKFEYHLLIFVRKWVDNEVSVVFVEHVLGIFHLQLFVPSHCDELLRSWLGEIVVG